MIPELRRAFNAAFTEERYRLYLEDIAAAVGCPIPFRVAETPIFLPPRLRQAMVRAALEIIGQLLRPEHQQASLAAVPPEWDVPNCDEQPLFVQADFAVVADPAASEGYAPRLIELQGFPSLYGFQLLQAQAAQRYVPGGERLEFLLSGLDVAGYRRVVGEAILGGHDPREVVLFDLDPPTQKTYPDFAATERLWGVRPVCPTTVEKRDRELWYDRDGTPTRIRRVYNRVIVEELVARRLELPFRYTEPLDVEWAGHPNWYFRWSKHSLPFLDHPAVPEAVFLADLDRWPDDLDRWVLKPLFSFGGTGVKVDLTPADLEAIRPDERRHYLLMRKVEYAPCIETADGNRSKAEVRVMIVWHRGRPLPVTTLVRLSQGKLMGVSYNRDRTWVGSSTSLWPPER